jgi:hypothetical protein
MKPCVICGKEVDESEMCWDTVCRGCHVTITIEDCIKDSERRMERIRREVAGG